MRKFIENILNECGFEKDDKNTFKKEYYNDEDSSEKLMMISYLDFFKFYYFALYPDKISTTQTSFKHTMEKALALIDDAKCETKSYQEQKGFFDPYDDVSKILQMIKGKREIKNVYANNKKKP